MEAGTLIVERTRVPYLIGCVLPGEVIRQRIVKSHLQVHAQQASLELAVRFDVNGQQHLMHIHLDSAKHHDFLRGLSDASALYLLSGSDHPTPRTICNRIHQGGVAVELTDHHKNLPS